METIQRPANTRDEFFKMTDQKPADTQDEFFQVTDQIPGRVWYWGAVTSIAIAAALKLMGRDNWAIFVGQWPPAFLLFGLYHKLLRPGGRT